MKRKSLCKFIPLILLLIFMYIIHTYVFLYADDLYYSRDAQLGVLYLPTFISKQFNTNGRIWVHLLLSFLVKYDVLLFRLINPLIITGTALLIAIISGYDTKNIFPGILISTILFLALPIKIANITLYYAACSLNYLYPTLISILFGYLLFKYYLNNNRKSKVSFFIIILSFFAGSSTQQAGMIAIGFAVLNTIYLIFIKKYKLNKNYILYFISLFLGYGVVTYGSIKRMQLEENNGVVVKITDTITMILRNNLFSKPISIFVLLICLSCVICLIKFTLSINGNRFQKYFNTLLILTIIISSFYYIYFVHIKMYSVIIFSSADAELKSRLFYSVFTIIYLFSILYTGVLILLNNKNAFILFCIINAIGAQVMMVVADSRFAGAYKTTFPSLLLMFIFITYAFTQLYNENNIRFNKLIFIAIMIPLTIVSFKTYYKNYKGYKDTSININYNLNAIKKYHENDDKSEITLRKVEKSEYGYNIGNWNDIPCFMKQCYNINENTIIKYIDK